MLKTSMADVLFGTNATKGLANTVQNTAASQKDLTNSFTDSFNSTAGKSLETKDKQQVDVKQSKTVVENKPVREVSEKKEQPNNETFDKNDEISAAKEIAEAGKQIIDKVKEEFDVTDEAIEEVMQTLGITFAELFNPEDLQKLIMEVTGTTDSIELITNDVLYNGINDMMNFMNGIKEELADNLGINDETFMNIVNNSELLNDINEQIGMIEEDVNETLVTPFDSNKELTENITGKTENEVEKPVDNTEDENALAKKIAALITDRPETETKTENKIQVEINNEKSEEGIQNDVEVKVSGNGEYQEITDNKTGSNNEHQNRKEHESNEGNENGFSLVSEMTTETVTVGDVVEVVETYTTTTDNQNIMRQITEHMKINISSDSTSMEMQLHPASLGTVNMQVISQNGQVTAHFTVQNEAVKAVLETQMLTLQETLAEQGTKVSAIEVSVASYNLDKGSENQPNEGNSQNNKKGYGKRSSIDLTNLDSFEDLDEDELMEAKVMEMNGNTVSYTV